MLLRGREEAELLDAAGDAFGRLSQVAPQAVQVMGPAPAPRYRVNRWYRAHVLLKGTSAATLRRCAEGARLQELERGGLQVVVDVDPADVM